MKVKDLQDYMNSYIEKEPKPVEETLKDLKKSGFEVEET